MNKKDQDRIPTLKNIVQVGDATMENHFDGKFVEEIKVDEPSAEAGQLVDEKLLDELINEVVNTTLPIIERQLRNHLATIIKKYQKSANKNSD